MTATGTASTGASATGTSSNATGSATGPVSTEHRGLRYLPGLDGLRAIAVVGVMLYHGDVSWVRGGFLGVDVFFVLSGFLITSLLLTEYARRGGIDFKAFYLRRARRLLPALLLMLLVVGIAAAWFVRDAASQVRQDIPASLGYVTNWWYILADQSYFEAIGRPPLLKHLWSLAVEEQFYLIWPVIAFAALRWGGRRAVMIVAVVGAIASTIWMAVVSVRYGFPVDHDPSRAYFGTDTHAMGLLVGAALATVWRPDRFRERLQPSAAAAIDAVGLLALAAVVAIFLSVGEYAPALYRGGFLVLAVVTAILIAAASHPGAQLGRWLGVAPMRWIGERSYGLYLWHWPIFLVTRPELDLPVDGFALLALRFGLTAVIADLSYRFVELPVRRGVLGRWWHAVRDSDAVRRAAAMRRAAVVGVAGSIAVVAIAAGLATAPAPDAAALGGVDIESVSLDDPADPGSADPGSADPGDSDPGSSDPGTSELGGPDTSDPGTDPGKGDPPPGTGQTPHSGPTTAPAVGTVTGIGDSVMLGARTTLRTQFPGIAIDAAVARQTGTILARVQKFAAAGKLAPVVVIHTGTNGVVPEDMLSTMLTTLADRSRVVIINDAVPRSWRDDNNATIAAVVPRFPNAVIADWRAVSTGHPEYFVADGVHLTGPGMHAYAEMIAAAIGS
ncbi:MAG: acyltransferase [Actinomycetota bacterium]|nr:MAG: acyltransferase [Actinomycetota bacterium]